MARKILQRIPSWLSTVLKANFENHKSRTTGGIQRLPRKWAGFSSILLPLVGLSLLALSPNTVRADDLPVLQKSGTLVSDETWSEGSVYLLTGALTIPNGVTLTIEAGTILKFQGPYYNDRSITVATGGALNVNGTSADPVIFTSYKDDSVGGDTNGGGVSSGTINDYLSAINATGGTTTVNHAIFRYSQTSLSASGSASLTVSDSEFRNGYTGVVLTGVSVQAVLQRNNFELAGGTGTKAIVAQALNDITGIVLSGVDKNTFTGSLQETKVEVTNVKVPSGKTWTVSGSTTGAWLKAKMTVDGTLNLNNNTVVESGLITVNGTLNAEAGTILKFQGPNYSSKAITVATGGTLNVSGTSSEPVILTSYKDDSVGGDTNGGGVSSGTLNDYLSAIDVTGGTATVSHGIFRYAATSLSAGGAATLTTLDSEFRNSYTGVVLSGASVQATLQRNHFELASGTGAKAILAQTLNDVTGIALSGADRNTFTGSLQETKVEVTNVKVPANKTWTVSGSTTGAWLKAKMTVDGTLNLSSNTTLESGLVTVNGTLNAEAGTILKIQGSSQYDRSISVGLGGTVNVNGTSTDPVTFTSYKDDSAGGDTNGGGASVGIRNDYGTALNVAGGTAIVSYGVFRYGNTSFSANGSSSVSVTDSEFRDSYYGVFLGNITATAVLQRNHFELSGGTRAIGAQGVNDVTGIALFGADKNTFTGNLQDTLVELTSNSKIPSGKTWTVSRDTTGAWLRAYLTVDGTLNLNDNMLVESRRITVNGSLNIESGTDLKFQGPSQYDYAITVATGGVLSANGTAQAPIIFTSYKDDSAGGDTNSGGASSGVRNDYGMALNVAGGTATVNYGIFRYSNTAFSASGASSVTVTDSEFRDSYYAVNLSGTATQMLTDYIEIDNVETPFYINDAQANLAHTSVSNATTGLDVRGSAKVTFRGDFSAISGKAIKACKWDQGCGVDAAYVDWGSAEGPAPTGSSSLVCGRVTVSPWKYGSNTYNGSLFTSENCDSSAGPANILGTNISYFQARMALEEIDCGNGYQDACEAMANSMTCLDGAMDVAQSTAPWELPPAGTNEQIEAFSATAIDGASNYVSTIEEVSVTQFNLGLFTQLSQVLGTVLEMGGAYSSCAP